MLDVVARSRDIPCTGRLFGFFASLLGLLGGGRSVVRRVLRAGHRRAEDDQAKCQGQRRGDTTLDEARPGQARPGEGFLKRRRHDDALNNFPNRADPMRRNAPCLASQVAFGKLLSKLSQIETICRCRNKKRPRGHARGLFDVYRSTVRYFSVDPAAIGLALPDTLDTDWVAVSISIKEILPPAALIASLRSTTRMF